MKKTMLLLLFICYSTLSYAQTYFEHLFTNERHNHLQQIAVNDQYIAVGGHAEDCDRPYIGLLSIDGEELWSNIPLPDYGRVTQIAFEDESTIYGTIQWSLGDDFPSEQDGFYFFRYDISGVPLVFDQYFSQIYNSIPVVKMPNQGFLIGLNNEILRLDEEGTLIDSIPFAAAPIYDIVLLTDSTCAVSYKLDFPGSTTEKVVSIIDFNGTILHNFESTAGEFDPIRISTGGSRVFVATPGQITIWDPFSGSTTSSLWIGDMPQMYYSDDWLYLCTIAYEEYQFVSKTLSLDRMDIEGNIEGILLDPIARQQSLREFVVVDSTLYLCSHKVFEEGSDRVLAAGLVQRIPDFSLPAPEDLDIGISFIEASNFVLDTLEVYPNGSINGRLNHDVEIEVTNFGNVFVDEFILASRAIGGFNCAEGRTYSRVIDADLGPGESMTFNWTHFLFGSFNLAAGLTYQSCFFTAAPNQKVDVDFENNFSCGLITSTDKLVIDIPLSIFPNPTSKDLTINVSVANEIKSISLFDQSGRQIFADNIDAFNKYTLQRQHWPSGLYYLKVQTRNGVRVEKVVFQD